MGSSCTLIEGTVDYVLVLEGMTILSESDVILPLPQGVHFHHADDASLCILRGS